VSAVERLLTHLELYAFFFLGAGAVLFLIALLWLLVAAFRGARARGPLTLFLLAALIALLPELVKAAHERIADLGRPVRILNSELQVGLREAGNPQEEVVRVKARAVFHLVGAAFALIGIAWLLVSAFRQWARVKWPVYLFLLAGLL